MASFGAKKPFLIPVIGLLHFLLGLAGFSLARFNPIFSPIWPAAAFGFSATLFYGHRVLPAIAIAAFFSAFVSGFNVPGAFLISAGNTFQAWIGVLLLKRYAQGFDFLNRVEDVLKFVLIGSVVCCTIGAMAGTLSEYVTRPADAFPLTFIWSRWWLAELMGILLVTPLIVAWYIDPRLVIVRARAIEVATIFLVLIVVTFLIFGETFDFALWLSYLIIPLLIWVVIRCGPKAATLAVVTVSMIALTGARNGSDPLQMKDSLLLIQLFVACVQITALVLIAHQVERESTEAILKREGAQSRALVERVPAIVYQVQFGSTVQWRYVSPRIKSILGFSAEEWMSDTQLWFKQIHPLDREEVLAKGMSSSSSGKPFVCEYRMFTRDARLVWFRDEGNVSKDPERKSALIQGVMLDITERKRSEILLAVLYRLAEETQADPASENYYSLVHQCVSELMDASNFYVALFDSSTQLFTFPYSVSERPFNLAPKNSGLGLPGYVVRSGPLLADTEKVTDLAKRGEVQDDGVSFVSWLGVPLKTNERTFGILAVQSFSKDKRYDHSDLEALLLVAAEVAKTLDQKRAEKALQSKTSQLQLINRAMSQFLETNDWNAAWRLLLWFVIQETQSEYGFIGVWNGSTLKVTTHEYGSPEGMLLEKGFMEFATLKNLFGSIVDQGIPVVSNDVSNDPRVNGAPFLPADHPPIRAFVGLPLKHANTVMGFIGVGNRKEGYTGIEIEKMRLPCQTAAVLYHSYLQSQKQEQLQDELQVYRSKGYR